MTDTRVLLLHGFEHTRPRGHWLWWLAEELRRARIPVQYPQMPSPARPSLAEWTAVARAELEMLGDGERVVVTHSLGGILWLHLAMGLEPVWRVDRVLMVAPPSEDRLTGALAPFAHGGVDPVHVAAAARSTTLVARDVDPYRDGTVDAVAARWGADGVELPGVGHLNPDDGHGPWAAALEWTMRGAVEWRLGEGARSLDA